jgi:hypothetical protein
LDPRQFSPRTIDADVFLGGGDVSQKIAQDLRLNQRLLVARHGSRPANADRKKQER